MKTVFIPPIINWSFLRQLPQQMASQFARAGYKVLFCNEKATIDLKKIEVEKNLIVYPNVEFALHEIEHHKIHIDIFYTTAAMTHRFIEMVNPDMVLYHSCDSFEEWKSIEHKIIDAADAIFCTSKFIYDLRKKQHGNVHLVMNGCNQEMIDIKYEEIDNFKFIKRPLCVFSGACGVWVRTYLLRNVGKEFYTLFVGQSFGKKIPDNVVHIPTLEHDKLVHFLYNMDLGMLPFNTKSEVARAANPIKMWEYLACGLPVIATDWEETNRKELKDVVKPASTDEEYYKYIESYSKLSDADRQDLKQQCFKVAKDNTWEKRFEIINENILKIGMN